MISEPRTIARIFELFHVPIRHTIEELRDVYLEVSSSCGYDNFMRQSGGARLESAATDGGAISRVSFQKDRISFVEEQSKASLENFRRRTEEVINVAADKLSIPIIVARNITVRAVAAAPTGRSAAQFISENLFRVTPDSLEVLERPAHIIGLRLQLPAPDPKGASHQVRIESYLRDPRSLFVEDTAAFKIPVQSQDHARLRDELREVDAVVHDQVRAFLNQFPR